MNLWALPKLIGSRILAWGAVLSLAALAVPSLGQGLPVNGSVQPVNWRTIESGVAPQARSAITTVMYTQGQFESFWRELYGNVQAPRVPVQWGREFLIGVCGGPQAAGASVGVTTVVKTSPSVATAYWGVRLPPFGKGPIQGSPWEIDAVEAFGGKLVFSQAPASNRTGNFTIIGPGWSGPPIIINNYSFGPGVAQGLIPFAVVDGGWYGFGTRSGCQIIENQAQLEAYFRWNYGSRLDVPRNFSWQNQMLAAINLGTVNASYGIQVTGIRSSQTGYQVLYQIIEPANAGSQGVMGQNVAGVHNGQSPDQPSLAPFLIIRIPRLNGPVTFVRDTSQPLGNRKQ